MTTDTALTDHLSDAHHALLRAYVACPESQRDAIGALVSAVAAQLTEHDPGMEGEAVKGICPVCWRGLLAVTP